MLPDKKKQVLNTLEDVIKMMIMSALLLPQRDVGSGIHFAFKLLLNAFSNVNKYGVKIMTKLNQRNRKF